MNIELINTGSELLLGRILNTHQQWIGRQLTHYGYSLARQTCVADAGADIQAAVREALARAEVVIVTGGLGPTSDDLTRDLLAQMLNRKLILDEGVLAHIEKFYTARNRKMPDSVKVQAMVPQGARVLSNPHGSAPGLAIEVRRSEAGIPMAADRAWLILLPGPPRELHPMFVAWVIPLIQAQYPGQSEFLSRTFRTAGLPESLVEQRVDAPLRRLMKTGLEVGYCAQIGQVEVRLSARGESAPILVAEGEKMVRTALSDRIFGVDEQTLESVVIALLTEKRRTVALAESCTGGFIAHRLTNVPGSSAAFLGGLVTYSNEAKQVLLGVLPETLSQFGAVSEPVALEMARGARERLRSNFALAVTGIAGPEGGTETKPVGTVYIALASAQNALAERHFFPLDRETFKFAVSQQALDWLRRIL